MRPATKARVEDAIKALNYRPSSSARELAGRRSFLVGLLYDNPSASYITNIQNGVLEVCREQGYNLLIHPCSYRQAGVDREIVDFVAHSRVDGLILTPPITDLASTRRQLKARAIPNVIISPASMRANPWSVGTNDSEVCAAMVHHLADLGHRDIAFIKGHPDHLAIANRHKGYLQGMAERGLKPRAAMQVQGFNSFESGVACAQKLLSLKRKPTAVFASNDDMAAGVLRTAHIMGYAIPGDLSVAGFDDIPLASQLWPSLTTIRQPIEEMAIAATKLLILQLRDRPVDDIERRIDSQLVIRDSTGPAPA